MDWMEIIKIGAQYIQNNDDESTSGIDIDNIAQALQRVLGGEGGIDLSSLLVKAQEGGVMEIVSSWIGSGENVSIDADTVTQLVSSDKVQELAQHLGISEESAKKALADALPVVVDEATSEDPSLAEQLLSQIGGIEGAMKMLKKLF
ncbi:hypothetical protein NitYY0826_C1684 [Nitratiruptor sp. YY08-26]|uniref:YidB family protein n=1 Tax=unclassified Nitratiruptor TaxID=2624044 RepID=UPI001915E34D|nr:MULTISPECIES: YidB family protein [unclassified Nitratiruptor]BCD62801.1 hypothetical protein NitYY0813_C1682 [Nitratiruptor sp. YY08-13]BCD66737.1 hypothetical protein NitYY0826_C1684 [Nitratiruptor sp. YY08-26]